MINSQIGFKGTERDAPAIYLTCAEKQIVHDELAMMMKITMMIIVLVIYNDDDSNDNDDDDDDDDADPARCLR